MQDESRTLLENEQILLRAPSHGKKYGTFKPNNHEAGGLQINLENICRWTGRQF